VFVEDVLVVVDEIAIATRPGAVSRRAEVGAVAEAAARWRPVAAIEAPGTVDGGDVLRLGRRLLVGRSGRTNDDGIRQLASLLAPFGYTVDAVQVRGCLHLKSAITEAGEQTVLVNPAWIHVDALGLTGWSILEVDPGEPHGANVLRAGDRVVASDAYPRTRATLERAGVRVVDVDVSEIAKAEGAVTCCSVLLG
jgi:dimethylargininase